ncbi:MAG: creatininase family protein [Chloroflexi bacterium]|nr:creatininase family protein [Chloroflexota bacterium]
MPPPAGRILLQDWTRQDAAISAGTTLLVLPVGATEQHGPHLPTGTDFLCVEHIARLAAARAAERIPVVVAPTLPFGSSHHHLPFGATLSLATETYYRVLVDLLESAIGRGFGRIFVLNGHGGNHKVVQLVARDLVLKHQASIAAASWWTLAANALVATGAIERGRVPGQAGALETALVLALRPELVREPRPHRASGPGLDPRPFADSYRVEEPGFWQRFDGYTDSPNRGEGSDGQVYFDLAIAAAADAFVQFSTHTSV